MKLLINRARLETNNEVLRIHTDNGSEFLNNSLRDFLLQHGIDHTTSAPRVPEQNGLVERQVRCVRDCARTMLIASKLPDRLWAEAINTSVYVLNRVVSKAETVTPYQLWFGRKPNVANLHIFGEKVVVKDLNPAGKWGPQGIEGRFVGYTATFNTLRILRSDNSGNERVYVHCDVIFLGEKSDQIREPAKEFEVDKRDEGLSGQVSATLQMKDDHPVQPLPLLLENTTIVAPGEVSRNSLQHENIDEKGSTEREETPVSVPVQERTPQGVSGSQVPTFRTGKGVTVVDRSTLSDSLKRKILQPKTEGVQSLSMNYQGSSFHPKLTIVRSELTPRQPDSLISIRPELIEVCKGCELDGVPEEDEDTNDTFYHQTVDEESTHALMCVTEKGDDDLSLEEALAGPQRDQWLAAMKEELDSLAKNEVWTLVDRPSNTNVVTNKWVLKIKRRPDGTTERFKARLVARGFSQMEGVDYWETYAPVANLTSIRMLFAYSAIYKWAIISFDIKTAFLYGRLDEEVFMAQPRGFEDGDKVCKLSWSLYGLKQSPRMWNLRFTECLKTFGLRPIPSDPCIFEADGVILCIYVDGGIIFSTEMSRGKKLLSLLQKEFEMREVALDRYLGLQIDIKPGRVILHQTSYIRKLLKKFGMSTAKSAETPMSLEYSGKTESPSLSADVPYRQAIGSLLYAAVTTRVDIMNAVSRLSTKLSNPTEADWIGVKRVMRYLVGKEHYGIEYRESEQRCIELFCDADFAGEVGYASTTGCVALVADGPVHWVSKKQSIITLSSTEAELGAICTATMISAWLSNIAQDLKLTNERSIRILSDNQSAIKLVKNEKAQHRTRHIGVRAAYPRSQIEGGSIQLEFVKGEEQKADILTKALPKKEFSANRDKLMNLTWWMAIATLVLSSVVALEPQQRHRYAMLRKSGKRVLHSLTEFKVNLGIKNPCHLFDDAPLDDELKSKCHVLHTEEVLKRVMELRATVDGRVQHRQFGLASLVPTVRLVYNICSNVYMAYTLGSTMASYADLIFGFSHVDSKLHGSTINRMKDALGIVHKDLEKIREDHAKNLDKAYGLMMVSNEIYRTGSQLQFLINSVEQEGTVDTRTLAKLMCKNTVDPNCEKNKERVQGLFEKDTEVTGVSYAVLKEKKDAEEMMRVWYKGQYQDVQDSPIVLTLTYVGVEQSRDSQALEYDTFNHWEEDLHEKRMIKYSGPMYVLFNKTTNCLARLLDQRADLVIQNCTRIDYRDPKLEQWDIEEKAVYEQSTVVKWARGVNYIYCHPGLITVAGVTQSCPYDPMRLPSTIAFNTSDLTYPGVQQLVLNITLDDVVVENLAVAGHKGEVMMGHAEKMLAGVM